MGKFNRHKICYHEVTQVERNGITYFVEVFGDGKYFKAYAGRSEEDENFTKFESTNEKTAIEAAITKYEGIIKPVR